MAIAVIAVIMLAGTAYIHRSTIRTRCSRSSDLRPCVTITTSIFSSMASKRSLRTARVIAVRVAFHGPPASPFSAMSVGGKHRVPSVLIYVPAGIQTKNKLDSHRRLFRVLTKVPINNQHQFIRVPKVSMLVTQQNLITNRLPSLNLRTRHTRSQHHLPWNIPWSNRYLRPLYTRTRRPPAFWTRSWCACGGPRPTVTTRALWLDHDRVRVDGLAGSPASEDRFCCGFFADHE